MYIVNGKIKTMAGPEFSSGVIRIEGDKIAEVGAAGQVDICPAEGEKVLDVKRSLLMPLSMAMAELT